MPLLIQSAVSSTPAASLACLTLWILTLSSCWLSGRFAKGQDNGGTFNMEGGESQARDSGIDSLF
jgi:hypothetical protein